MRIAVIASALIVVASMEGSAQAVSSEPCTYARCALGLAPVLTGLDLVRGVSNERVGGLNFFWPHNVRAVLGANDSSPYHADRALQARVIGATFADLAAVLLAATTVRAIREHGLYGSNIGLALGGAGLLGLSVPFQFSADGHLSRAVWWHNATLVP